MKEGDEEIDGMLILLQIMMTLSSSTAACERGFPCMKNQKPNYEHHLAINRWTISCTFALMGLT